MSKFTVYTTDKEPARTTVFIRCVSGISVVGGDSYTDEQAQDAVGTILANTANINLTYDDGTPQITANLTTAVTDSLAKADTALQPSWAGSASVTTVGTIATGIWHGTSITDAYIASAATWNALVSADGSIDTHSNVSIGAPVANSDGTLRILADTNTNGIFTVIDWTPPTSGGGDVSKVGTPVDNQIGVWTGDGTIEGDTNLTWSGTVLDITGAITVSGNIDGRDISTDGTKLDTIETNADITDTANVTAAGALMDSEVDANLKTLILPANTTISAFIQTLLDDANQAVARATLGVDAAGTDNSTNVTLVGTPDYITISGQEITRNQIDLTNDVAGVLPIANYATGIPDGTKFVRDDGQLITPPDTDTTDHTALSNIGTNTHAQIDTHLANTANPHSVTKAQIGLANADNTSDANKPISTATQTALDLKADKSNVLELDNTSSFTPDADYEPATKKYVDDITNYTVRIVAGTTDTLVIADKGNLVRYTSATDITVTVPAGLGADFFCLLAQDADGQVIWSASGTTIKCLNNHTRTGGNGAIVTLLSMSANNLTVSGPTGV